ncbi:MAG: 23S rRNA (uracil(1939)-C(5))-methyltransferase RlmD [Eubacterium sp.]|nr:23S rRNA (uracil(1939)-C(5))-methyltransferase RlmD [Eubacterium sp.]
MECKVNKKCGGCQNISIPYSEQLKHKQERLENLLTDFCKVEKIIGMENPYRYRNKVQSAFFFDYNHKKNVSGVYQSGSGKIIKTDSCLLENEKADKIINSVRKLLDSFKLRAYDTKKDVGFLRHVLVRTGFNTGEIMVVLVTAKPAFQSKNNFVKALLKDHPGITTIIQNVNPNGIPLTLSQRNNTLYGRGYIEDTLCGMKFRISPDSFYQVNPVQCEKLYDKAMEFANLTGNETVFDSYCGTGTIGLIASKKAKQVLGVELNKSAVKDAISNAKENGAENIYFLCGDAGEIIEDMANENEKFDVVFMDPPRAGSSVKFLNSLIKIKPEKIVYVSCNPETLARDLAILTKKHYRVKKIQGVDMFPHTKHIETVCLLEWEK